MKVISAPGTRCPKEKKPRVYITDSAPQEVPETIYYRRLLADGSLTVVQPEPVAQASRKAMPKPVKED
jgi:hypothetical protein